MKTLNTLDIKGLFGRYDFSINFRDKNGLVMLAAPNGYGKSTILRMIHAILCGNVFFFNELHFSEIHLTFASGNPGYRSGVDIIKRYKNDDYADEYVIHNEESLTDDSIDPYTAEREYEEYLASLNEEQRKKHEEELARIEEEEANQYPQKERIQYEVEISYYTQYPESEYVDRHAILFNNRDVADVSYVITEKIEELELIVGVPRFDDEMEADDVWRACWRRKSDSREMILSEVFFEYGQKYRKIFEESPFRGAYYLSSEVGMEHMYVDADRNIFTVSNAGGSLMDADSLSKFISSMGESLVEEAEAIAAKAEDLFSINVVKVLREKRSADILRPMVMEKMDKFIAMEKHCNEYDIHCYSEKRREKIRKHFNNMQHEVTVDLHALPVDCDEASLEVYNLLLDAHIEELSVYDDFLNRLDTYKQFVTSILNGVTIIPSIHGVRAESIVEERYYFFPIAKNIDLKRLSSGERHMVVLAGLLLFYKSDFCHRCDESLVLMDEPEISLHPAWQEALAYFCWKVKSQYNKDFVFATHSPVFVNGYSDRMIDLRDAEVKGD